MITQNKHLNDYDIDNIFHILSLSQKNVNASKYIKRCKPERESKHAAVTGHPSKFNRESLWRPET